MPITKFDKTTCHFLGQEVAKALQEIATRHGLTVTPAGGTYSELTYTGKLKFEVADPTLRADAERAEFTQFCSMYGLTTAHYRNRFVHQGETFTLVGFMPGRQKFCLKAVNSTGKVLLFPQTIATRLMAAA